MLKLPKNEGLNIVPFIDIMLVLLAIVLSLSSFIAHSKIELKLPVSENSTSFNESQNKFFIAINERDEFFLNDEKVNLDQLKNAILALDKDTMVALKSDKFAKFESFVKIIDLLKIKEHEKIQIITEKNR
ncbi:TonB system transport protein ExbD [Campylobacter upsaliensis]|uniref:TonB system transport protein ExbD n=1 Tax=Campylobacter upsaliensis TaxID=28080 RepID=UPI00004B3EFC|nr:TonB system transport protein ExbD [Campylobacter upsaliensis]EAH6236434.1 TonB system transport protein ExbD [Campylobacter upsaliensis]EAL3917425.1 TonB system transport protein ExbD [Campylobacter upsaliensis]EAL3924847.1 TonB system transport protein ExbD [Campylobacter upsaliensis]EAL53113.1 TonB system transport protein ExbD, putative [Campylobacter upsaliensis RM3195]EHE0558509.1 TonB system transport protein ExbD [Campylobacter upsaliensis]